jgi:probable addiction module antidote protein
MDKVKRKPFDPAELLTTPEAMSAYMSAAFRTGDQAFIADARGIVARAKAITENGRANLGDWGST